MPCGAGNVIILGADPAKHANYLSQPAVAAGAQKLIEDGITYAASGMDGNGNTATGAYICLSQYFYYTVRSSGEFTLQSLSHAYMAFLPRLGCALTTGLCSDDFMLASGT